MGLRQLAHSLQNSIRFPGDKESETREARGFRHSYAVCIDWKHALKREVGLRGIYARHLLKPLSVALSEAG